MRRVRLPAACLPLAAADGEEFEAVPGSFVFLPRALPHRFRSVGGPATGLLIATPAGLEDYFAELHAATAADADKFEISRIQAAHGIHPAHPIPDPRHPVAACGRR